MFSTEAIKRAALYGVAGTVMMTVFTFVADHLHLPKVDMHDILGHVLAVGTQVVLLIYFAMGAILAFVYKAYFHTHLPNRSWTRGAFYGFFLWFVAGIAMPVFGMGFFTGSMTTAVGMLIGLAVYGATVGYLYDRK